MRTSIWKWLVLGVMIAAASAQAGVAFEAGLKGWYAEPKVADRVLMVGPEIDVRIGDIYWVRGFYIYGEFDYIQQREPRMVQDFSLYDAEILAGFNWDIFKFGVGLRGMSVLIEQDSDPRRVTKPDAFGPTLAIGAEQSFAEWPWGFEGSPWGWYADTSWMFADFEDDKGEHINFEAGFTYQTVNWRSSLGYRFKHTFDHDRMEGFVASVRLRF